MKLRSLLSFTVFLFGYTLCGAQVIETKPDTSPSRERKLTIEPGVGIHTNFGTDVLISNLIQWNPNRRLSFAAHSLYAINNIAQRNFNNVKTNLNYSLNQKFGVGATLYRQRSSSTFLLMMGVKYTSYQESLEHPNLDKVSVSISALSLDYGVLYSFKLGWKKYFFTSRFYLPLHPWLTKGANMDNIQGTLRDIALEFGVGIKIK